MMNAPIYGLYLAGGKSSRMGSPKWALAHKDGLSFLEHACGALEAVCEKVFLSSGAETLNVPSPHSSYTQIPDRLEIGPLSGIISAHEAHPEASWLVLACDLPALTQSALAGLIAAGGDAETVAYANPIDGVPEATATLYSPSALRKISVLKESGDYCLRHALEAVDLRVLPAPSPYTLQNVNYPADYTEWTQRALHPPLERKVSVEFYAKLRQDAGTEKVSVQTHSLTVAGLWEECRLSHRLSLKQPSVKPAANNSFVPWDYLLNEGDLIAFMPPFAGG